MSHIAAIFSLLVFLAILHLGRMWVEEGVNEQFYSLSATDATGQNIPMSSYVGKVKCHCDVCSLLVICCFCYWPEHHYNCSHFYVLLVLS